jgi:hypothetical protein
MESTEANVALEASDETIDDEGDLGDAAKKNIDYPCLP